MEERHTMYIVRTSSKIAQYFADYAPGSAHRFGGEFWGDLVGGRSFMPKVHNPSVWYL